jgi:hypothetical protein
MTASTRQQSDDIVQPERRRARGSRSTERTNREQDVQENGRQSASQNGRQLSQTLEYEIVKALEPVVSNLQQQVARSVRARVEEVIGDGPADRDSPPARRRETQKAEDRAPEPGTLQQTGDALQQSGTRVADMLRSAIDAVRSWLAAVIAFLRRTFMRLLVTVVMALVRPMVKAAVKRSLSSLQQQGMRKLQTLGAGAS